MSLKPFQLLVRGLIVASFSVVGTYSASAADLVFGGTGHVVAGSGIEAGTNSGYYRLSQGRNSPLMARVPGKGFASATSTLRFTGPANAPIIAFYTTANPDVHHRNATSKMYTSVNPNRGTYDHIPVTVRGTGSQRAGTRVRVEIKVSYQATITRYDGTSQNFLHLSINGAEKARLTNWNSRAQSGTFNVDTVIGSTFYIGFYGGSHAIKGSSASQTLTVEMRVP